MGGLIYGLLSPSGKAYIGQTMNLKERLHAGVVRGSKWTKERRAKISETWRRKLGR